MIPERVRDIIRLAADLGLDFYDIKFEEIPWDVMNEIAAYGLPTRAQHWSYGRVYQRQRLHGEMGLSKIYEIVLNNDPAYAFMLDTNTEVQNLLITAHVAAHADFFKNNTWFEHTSRSMVSEAAEHAVRIEQYKEEYGLDAVERLMDAAFALERHIDPYKGLIRKPYPKRKVVEKEARRHEYSDLFPGEQGYSLTRTYEGGKVPAHPERDLLWFLAQHAPLEDWERDTLEIIREESYYFYPQFNTKIMNEGWASYWHAEIINRYDGMSPSEMVDFAALHAGVVRPAGRLEINPYYLGYKIFVDIERRWDAMHAAGESTMTGREKMFDVRTFDDDFSFLRNYLTDELIEELELYTYAPACDCNRRGQRTCPRCGEIAIVSREADAVVETLLRPRYNYGVPKVVVVGTEGGVLELRQEDWENGGLDRHYAEKTLEFLHALWKAPVIVHTVDDGENDVCLRFDERGFR